METILLLNKEDFIDYADLPESLEMDRLRPHILAAQRTRLLPLLTASLLTELLLLVSDERAAAGTAQPDPVTGAWQQLREQAVAVVACAAMARYMPFSQTSATSHSIVRKTAQYSEPVDGRDLARQASIYDGETLSYETSLTAWLKTNASSFAGFYPQLTCCGTTPASRTPSVVVQAIRRPEDNLHTEVALAYLPVRLGASIGAGSGTSTPPPTESTPDENGFSIQNGWTGYGKGYPKNY